MRVRHDPQYMRGACQIIAHDIMLGENPKGTFSSLFDFTALFVKEQPNHAF
jgi:hypothetical protein